MADKNQQPHRCPFCIPAPSGFPPFRCFVCNPSPLLMMPLPPCPPPLLLPVQPLPPLQPREPPAPPKRPRNLCPPQNQLPEGGPDLPSSSARRSADGFGRQLLLVLQRYCDQQIAQQFDQFRNYMTPLLRDVQELNTNVRKMLAKADRRDVEGGGGSSSSETEDVGGGGGSRTETESVEGGGEGSRTETEDVEGGGGNCTETVEGEREGGGKILKQN